MVPSRTERDSEGTKFESRTQKVQFEDVEHFLPFCKVKRIKKYSRGHFGGLSGDKHRFLGGLVTTISNIYALHSVILHYVT